MRTDRNVAIDVRKQPPPEISPETLQNQLQAKSEVCQRLAKDILAGLTSQRLFGMEGKLYQMRKELLSLAQTNDQIKKLDGDGLNRINIERVQLGTSACDMVLGVIQLGRTANYFPELIEECDLGSTFKCVLDDDGPLVVRKAMEQVAKIDPFERDKPRI